MTPEARAQSVLHFLDEYLSARERALEAALYATRALETPELRDRADAARQFLGTALVALVTDTKPQEDSLPPHMGPPCHLNAFWVEVREKIVCSVCGQERLESTK